MARCGWLLVCALLVAGCASHEGGLSQHPKKEKVTVLTPAVPAKPQPVSFRYAPDKGEYLYVETTKETPAGGTTSEEEKHFTVIVGKKGEQFTNVTTVQSMVSNGAPLEGIADKLKPFHIDTVVNRRGEIVSSHALGNSGIVPSDAKDLGTAFVLPTKPMLPGGKWIREVKDPLGAYQLTYTFLGVENTGKQRIATFEQQGKSNEGAEIPRPVVIKIDADTGVMIDRVGELVFVNPDSPGHEVTVQFEIKLQ